MATKNPAVIGVVCPRVLLKARSILRRGGSVFLYNDNNHGGGGEPFQALGQMRNWGHGAAALHCWTGVPMFVAAGVDAGKIPFTLDFEELETCTTDSENSKPNSKDVMEQFGHRLEEIESKYGIAWDFLGPTP